MKRCAMLRRNLLQPPLASSLVQMFLHVLFPKVNISNPRAGGSETHHTQTTAVCAASEHVSNKTGIKQTRPEQ
jgi:hypothetical protein